MSKRGKEMTIFDYLQKNYGAVVYRDEAGNAYIDGLQEIFLYGAIEAGRDIAADTVTYMLSKELFEKHSEIEIAITEDESVNAIEGVRRPYYRMRGVPVTREQAFDLIRRTDNFFSSEIEAIGNDDEFVECLNFDNWLIMKNHYPAGYGWIHTDGTVGTNGITQKFPTVSEFIEEWYNKLFAFPYLDLIIAVTWCDETPGSYDSESALNRNFKAGIRLGIYVHDRKLEILNEDDALEKYKEYDKLYGTPPEKFEPEYYQEHNIVQVDLPYLKKCMEAYGLNADEELAKVKEYTYRDCKKMEP